MPLHIRRRIPRLWLGVGCIAVLAFAYLMLRGCGNTFVFDEWGWIEFRRNGVGSILMSYNDHLLVAPLAVYQLLFRVVGLADYVPYRALAAVGHLLCVAAVFEFVRRRAPRMALLVALPLAFLGAGWEYELEGINFGFTVAIALGVVAVIVDDGGSEHRDLLTCGALMFGLLFSEFTVLFAVGIGVTQLVRERSLRRAWVWIAPLLVYGAWWLAYYTPIPSSFQPARLPKFAADMMASAAGGLFGLGLDPGRVILLGLLVLVAWRIIRRGGFSSRLAGLIATALLFWLSIAASRQGLSAPWASHYVYVGAVLLILIVTESLRAAQATAPRALAAAVALSLLALVGNIRAIAGGEAYLHTATQRVEAELGELRELGAHAAANLVLDPRYAPQLIAGPYRSAAHQLGAAPSYTLAELHHAPPPIQRAAIDLRARAARSG